MSDHCDRDLQFGNQKKNETCGLNLTSLYEQARPSIAQIKARNSMGSGFQMCDKENNCVIVTANHVVHGEKQVKVSLDGQPEKDATVVSRDTKNDTAILKINSPQTKSDTTKGLLPNLELTNKGEGIFGVGHAYGLKQHVISPGTVDQPSSKMNVDPSKIGRGPKPPGQCIDSHLKGNPGQSGGPVLNDKGHVIGLISGGEGDKTCVVPIKYAVDLARRKKS